MHLPIPSTGSCSQMSARFTLTSRTGFSVSESDSEIRTGNFYRGLGLCQTCIRATANPLKNLVIDFPLCTNEEFYSSKYLSACCVLSIVLGIGDPAVNKVEKNPCLYGAYILVGEGRQQAKPLSKGVCQKIRAMGENGAGKVREGVTRVWLE